MRIRIVGHAGECSFPFTESGPWLKFKENLLKEEDCLVTSTFDQGIDLLICHGYSSAAIKEAKKSQLPKHKMILVLWEPPITNPKLHSNKYLSKFGFVYSPSTQWAKNHNALYFNWPIGGTTLPKESLSSSERSDNPVIIQGNKVNFFKGENYSLRREVLFKSLQMRYPIMLYGHGWQRVSKTQFLSAFINFICNPNYGLNLKSLVHFGRIYPNYLGISNNKFTALRNHKISVVIENHSSYLSEKIFDSLNSGCITLYVGPDLTEYGLNRDMAIQVPANSDFILETVNQIMSLSEKELTEIKETQKYWLDMVKNDWNNEKVLANLALSIRKNLENGN
jgi:hypothetical protein